MALIIAFITILICTITLQILCNILEIVNFREKMAYILGFIISEIDCTPKPFDLKRPFIENSVSQLRQKEIDFNIVPIKTYF